MPSSSTSPAGPSGSVNLVVLSGVLSRDPDLRTLPSGDDLVAYEVTVARPDGPADTAPVVWVDPPRRRAALSRGDAVVVVGRVRRRFYRAGGSTQSRTEVVASKVVRAASPAASVEALRREVDMAIGADPDR